MADAYYNMLVSGLRNGQFYMYVNVATLTVWAVDYIATFDYEVEYMWPPKLNLVSFLFLLTRYLPIADMTITLYTQHTTQISVSLCILLAELYVWLIYAGMAVAEALLTLRVWALYGKGRKLTAFLLIVYGGSFAASGAKIYLSLNSLEVMIVPIPGRPDVCFTKSYDQQLYLYWVFMIILDAVSCVMLLIQMAKAFRTGGLTNLMRVVYRDGVIFYLVLLCFSVVNIFAIVILPAEISSLLTAPERILHAVLAGRVILNTRHQVREDKSVINLYTIPSFDAARPEQFLPRSLSRKNLTSPIVFSSDPAVSLTDCDIGSPPSSPSSPSCYSRDSWTDSPSTKGSTIDNPGPIFEAAMKKQRKRQQAKMQRSLRMAQRCGQRQFPITTNYEPNPNSDPDPNEFRISTVSRNTAEEVWWGI